MIKSIRYFLLFSLLLSITLASAINGIGNYLLDEKIIHPYLDVQLARYASLINVFVQSVSIDNQTTEKFFNLSFEKQPILGKKFIFQVWDKHNKLIMQSPNPHHVLLKDAELGFNDQSINGETWRIYALENPLTMKIVVAELHASRNELANSIIRSNANLLLIIYPLFGVLVWIIISFALSSISRVTTEISNRASTFLEPVELAEIPIEIKPLLIELNLLFIRLRLAFDRNKRFAADAAHELRTPLAALKTHVQVALNAETEADRNNALHKVIESVDRSSHVVDQLLTLSRLGEEEALTDTKPIDLHKVATEIIAYLAPHALEKNIEIELVPSPSPPIVFGNDTAIGIMIRNIVDNAIRYTPEGGAVTVSIIDSNAHIIFRVTDTGTGIPVQLRERVFERFFRVLGTKAAGSGLGLAIVSQIAALHHAEIMLGTPPNGTGLQFDVAFPKHHD